MSSGRWSFEDQPHHTSADWTVPLVEPNQDDLKRAADALNAGRKVAIMIGAGARGAAQLNSSIVRPSPTHLIKTLDAIGAGRADHGIPATGMSVPLDQ